MSHIEDIGLYDINKIKKAVTEGLKTAYDIDSGKTKIWIDNIEFGSPNRDPNDWEDLREAKINKETIGLPYYATINVQKSDGGADKKRTKIGILPIPTKFNTFMVNGNHFNVPTQFRLKPGAYARTSQKGEHEIFFNFANGMPLRVQVDPEKKKINLKYRQAILPIYPVLKSLGVEDKDIHDIVGDDAFDKMKSDNYVSSIQRVHKALTGENAPDELMAAETIRNKLQGLELNPETTSITLGEKHTHLNGRVLARSMLKLINIMNSKENVDNRDALGFKKVYSIDDIIEDKFKRESKIRSLARGIRYKMDSRSTIDSIVNKNDMDRFVTDIFTSSSLSRYADTTNPVAMITNAKLTTPLGEGGVKSADLMTDDAKQLQNTHLGFLDIAHTPESYAAGVTLFMTEGAKKKGQSLTTKVINVATGEVEEKTYEELSNEAIAFPGEFKKDGNKYSPARKDIMAIENDKKVTKGAGTVKYMIASPRYMFDLSANTVPFIQTNQGNRMLTSSKMATQSLLLDNPDEPLVDVFGENDLISSEIGSEYCVRSKVKGKVTKISDDTVFVKTEKGTEKYKIPRNVPLNESHYIDGKIKVKVGDELEEGSLIADTNATVNGKFANGKNLNVAYLNFKGLNYNDGIAISENAAKSLASTHMHRITVPLNYKLMDIKKIRAFDPYAIKDEDEDKYDHEGIIKPGTTVKTGDPIALFLKEKRLSTADSIIQRMRKSRVGKYVADKTSWDHDTEGTVTHVKKNGDNLDIYIKTIEPCKVGDKLVGRHGNKATISAIIPDAMTPVSESGEKIDIFMDPLGVHTRINTGQLLESAAGRIAAKLGKPYIVKNFDGKDYRSEILKKMKELGIKEKESIFDPESGVTTEPCFIGKQYIHKLKHQVDKKISSRGIDGPYSINQQPVRGKGVGGQSLDNLTTNVLLSHNARNIIRESASIKNNPNREYWQAVMSGEVPPPPKIPYEWNKFESTLKGMGINIIKNNNKLKLSPLTDKDIAEISAGEINAPYKTFIAKGDDIVPDTDGLFGENTGGLRGEKFNHITLPFEIPHPTYKKAIRTLCGMTEDQYNKAIEGVDFE